MKIFDYLDFWTTRVYAQQHGTIGANAIQNPLNADSVQALVADILKLVYQVGLPIVVLMFIYAGFLYVTARGNSTKIEDAHKTIWYTIVGAAIVLGAAVIASIIKGTIESLGN